MEPEGLQQLGQKSEIPQSPDNAILDTFPNPYPADRYLVRFSIPEFTSICPVTGQPDFARLLIDYVPDTLCVESKSLKLFMGSFRNHGDFHEKCTVYIARRLTVALTPRWLRIMGIWFPRGGIPIDVFWQSSKPLDSVWVPEPQLEQYFGR